MSNVNINRRGFLKTGMVGSAAAGLGALPCLAEATKREREPFPGLKIGITSYSLRKYSLDEALEKTKAAGVKYFSIKEVHLALKSTPEERRAASKKIADSGLVLMGGGVIYVKNDPADIRNMFEYAKDLGMKTIVCSPDPDALDEIEKRVKEYDFRIAIHNHGPGDKRYPSPMDVMRMVESRDSRMGLCIDVGHTVRLKEDPIAAIKKCAKRLYDFHLKDVTAATASGKATELGKGVIDIPAVLGTLVKLKWPYHVALEYEANGENPVPGMMESYAYIRGVLDALA